MSHLTDNNPMIQEAYEEMQRFFANPETHDKARERQRYIKDFRLITNASKAEGKAEGEAKSIVYTLRRRFSIVPEEMQTKLLAITDVDDLDRLMALAFDCQSLEEFVSQLR